MLTHSMVYVLHIHVTPNLQYSSDFIQDGPSKRYLPKGVRRGCSECDTCQKVGLVRIYCLIYIFFYLFTCLIDG